MHSFDEEKFLSRSYSFHPIRSSSLKDEELEYLRSRYLSKFPELKENENEPRIYCQLLWAELKWGLKDVTPYCSVCGGIISPDRLKVRILELRRGESGTSSCGSSECRYELVAITSEERYGVDHPFKSDSVRELSKQTMLKKYGVEHWNQSDELKEKSREKYFEKTEYYHHLSNPEVIKTRENSLLEKFGVSNVFQLEEVKDKLYSTNLERYGDAIASRTSNVKQKMVETNFEKYGCKSPTQNKDVMYKNLKTRRNSGNRVSSSLEDFFIKNFLDRYQIQYVTGELDLVKGNDYDIYIPSKKLVIELNGEYYHSLDRKTEDYHFNRTNELASIGIKCIYFWDFEIYSDKETEYIIDILDFRINSKINSSIRNLLDSSEDLDRDKFSELDFPTYSVLKSEPEIRNQGSTQERIIVRSGILRRNK